MQLPLRLLAAIAITVVSLVTFFNARPAQTKIIDVKDDGAFLQAGQTSYTRWRVEQRIKPLQHGRLADPYHSSEELHQSSFIVERRIQQGQDGKPSKSSVKLIDNKGTLLSATTLDGSTITTYDRASNVFESRAAPQGVTRTPKQGHIMGAQDTKWGPAWVLSMGSESVAPNEGSGTPYYADLHAIKFERQVTVLKDTHRIVQQVMQVTTTSGRVVPIMVQTLEQLEVKANKNVLDQDLDFTPPADADRVQHQANSAESVSLADVQRAVSFKLFTPDEQQAQLTFQAARLSRSPQPQRRLDKRVFDIQTAVDDGDVVELRYLSASTKEVSKCAESDATCSMKTLVVIQGPAQQLRQKMKKQRLLWDASRPIVIDVQGQHVAGYLATGGAYEEANQIVFLAEVDGTFIFLLGQHYSEAELLTTAATLRSTP